jgi:hypothetical protein
VRDGAALRWSTAEAQRSGVAVSTLLDAFRAGRGCHVELIRALDVPGTNTFAMTDSPSCACGWDAVVKSWSAERLPAGVATVDAQSALPVAHRVQTQGRDVQALGCAQGAAALGDKHCEVYVCGYAPQQPVYAGRPLGATILGSEVACPSCCQLRLPCVNSLL